MVRLRKSRGKGDRKGREEKRKPGDDDDDSDSRASEINRDKVWRAGSKERERETLKASPSFSSLSFPFPFSFLASSVPADERTNERTDGRGKRRRRWEASMSRCRRHDESFSRVCASIKHTHSTKLDATQHDATPTSERSLSRRDAQNGMGWVV